MSTNAMTLAQSLDALAHERFQSIINQNSMAPEGCHFVRLQAEFALGKTSAHEVLRHLHRMDDDGDLDSVPGDRALHLGLEAAFAIRSLVQAEDWLARREQSNGFVPAWKNVAEVEIALAFDDRDKAKKLFASSSPSEDTSYMRAKLAYVQGDFDDALELLSPLTDESEFSTIRLKAWRLAAQAHAGARNFQEEAKLLEKVIECLPEDAATIGRERLELAAAYTAFGDADGLASAEAQLRMLADAPSAGLAGYAQKRLEYVDKARAELGEGKAPRQARLPFPTVHQKRNYCGPAVLELCLRSLGIELGQDEIATSVKRERGTPMYELVAFLEARDIEARRIVANLDRLRAAIDLGLPVIIQEEYSTTCHVAVLTGYDDRLGLFVCQDPMTHRAQLKSYEWVQDSGQLFGNGVVVVVGRRSEIDKDMDASLEAAEILSHDAFAMLDEADRMRASAQGQQEAAVVQEVLAACQKALESDPDYQLAWHRRAWAELRRYRGDRNRRPAAQRSVHTARVNWRGAEWPHQLHASMLEHEGRWREAYVEHLSAHRCDPSDGENLASMSFCQGMLGDVSDGIENGHHALRVLPSHDWVAAELAVQYTQVLEHSRVSKWTDPKELPWLHMPANRPCQQSLDLSEDEIFERLGFYTMLAREQKGDAVSITSIWCRQAALQGDFEEAIKRLRDALTRHEKHVPFLFQLARASLLSGDRAGAQAAVDQLLEVSPTNYRSWLAAAEVVREDTEAAWALLNKGLEQVGTSRSELIDALWALGSKLGGGSEAAAVLFTEISETYDKDAEFVRHLADQIDRSGQRGLAVQLYRRVVEGEAGDLNSRYRLGTLLADDPLTIAEGRDQLSEVLQMAPSATVVRVRLAWCLLEDPKAGMEVLAPAMPEGDPKVFETACHLLRDMEQPEVAAQMRAQALGAYPSEDDARAELGAWHYYSDRYDLAIELLAPLTEREFTGTADLEFVQSTILTAYRLSGRIDEIQEWVRGLCKENIPSHLAYEVYWAFRSTDSALAAVGARVQAKQASSPSKALEFETNAASCDTRSGDMKSLEQIIGRLDSESGFAMESRLDAWETIFHAYTRLKKMSEAHNALEKMREINPTARATLATVEHFASMCGKGEDAFAAALKLRELYPYQHMGDERLGILYGTSGNAEKALEHAERALSIAPYCHISHASGALAHFAAGDLKRCRVHMERAEALDKTETPRQWSAFTALMHALRGDTELFEACVVDRSRTMDNDPYPEYEARLRKLLKNRD